MTKMTILKRRNNIDEIWKPVAGFEGRYDVSNTGEVFSRLTNKILKHNITPSGYHSVELFRETGKSSRMLIHRIVATAFLPNPFGYPQINHIDENKANNNVANLEWCSAKYNMNYGEMAKKRHSLIDYTPMWRKELARKNGKSACKPVIQYSKSGDFIARFESAKEAARETGINASHIGECCQGHKVKSAGGYVWKYERSEDLRASRA